jgi:hypothetical protein
VEGPYELRVGEVSLVVRLRNPAVGQERANGTIPDEQAPVEFLPDIRRSLAGT